MAVTSGWGLGSQADREAGWDRTVPLGVAGVTRRGPVDGSDVGWDVGFEAEPKPECDRNPCKVQRGLAHSETWRSN
jgi:hypothetical protein